MRTRASFRRDRFTNKRGIAIVIVLWVVLVLSLLISGFAFTMHVETQVASYARKELKAEMLARSGVEVARMQLIMARSLQPIQDLTRSTRIGRPTNCCTWTTNWVTEFSM